MFKPLFVAVCAVSIAQPAFAAEERRQAFDIAAQDVASALNAWSRQTGIQVLFPYRALAGRRSVAVRGTYTPSEALALLIKGQPVTIASRTADTVALAEPQGDVRGDGDAAAGGEVPNPEIIVLGQREALRRALESERSSDNLVNVVSATDIGQFADQNVAESLQRVPGVTLDRAEGEGRSVSVRGLPSAFTPVTVNGVRLGTSNLNTSEAVLDSISNDQLGSIEVTKAPLPSQDADTIGGTINLTSISGFNSPGTRLTLRAENVYTERASESAPRIGATLLTRALDDRLGIAASFTYARRVIEGVELESEEGLDDVAAAGTSEPEVLRPEEVAVIFETGERERLNATVNLEFRPSDGAEFFVRGTWSRLTDDDVSYRDIFDLDSATGGDVAAVRPRGGIFNDVDYAKRLFFQDITDEIWTASAGGRVEQDGWRVSGQVDYSRSTFDNPEALRGRFRARDTLLELDGTDTWYDLRPRQGQRGNRIDPELPGAYTFDQLLAVSEYRTDEVFGANLDVGRELALFGAQAELATGARVRLRDKRNDREEFTGNPGSFDFDRTLDDVPLFRQQSGFGYETFYPQLGPSFALFREARASLVANNPDFQREDLSASGDYRLTEDIYAGYVQLRLDPSPAFRIIGGVRVEHTKSASSGFYTEFDGSGRGPGGGPGIIADLGEVTDSYTKFFPGVHLRWEAARDLLVRASYNRGLQRPDFDDRRNLQRVQVASDDPDERDLVAGNPFLQPLVADQFDATIAWYPMRDTVLQASAFYKRLDDFFINFTGDGSSLGALGLTLPPGVGTNFDQIRTTINGDTAEVKGVEFQALHTFSYLPGPLSGLFVQGNLTLVDSTSTASVRAGEEFSLPEQRDVVGNLSVGYEDRGLLLRLSGNYQGEALVDLASSAEEDVFAKESLYLDFNLRIRVGRQFELTFDALNLTDESEVEFYRGDAAGPLVFANSIFGRTYQIGTRLTF